MTFEQLQLSEYLLKAISEKGYTTPTPIQSEAIPAILDGKDLIACAQTGTGKSAAFALPVIQQLSLEKEENGYMGIRALILAPTRELATQIEESFSSYAAHTSLNHTAIFGGIPRKVQIDYLSREIDILVATPGRLLDLHEKGYADLSNVRFFVLDEADNMLNLGFIEDVKKVISLLPEKKQTLLFSATIPFEIRQLCDQLLHDPLQISIRPQEVTAGDISQTVLFVEKSLKQNLLLHILQTTAVDSAFIFCKTRKGTDELSAFLNENGYTSEAIHSERSQMQRNQAIERFKNKEFKYLIATDVAARGIDVQNVSHVLNYDLPQETENYVHRIGRTGRAGNNGVSITLCTPEELGKLKETEKYIRQKIRVTEGHLYSNVHLLRRLLEAETDLEKKRKEANRRNRRRK
ncbi:MAG: DEAD/DEAH box helicase [Bacteroidales bacterium]